MGRADEHLVLPHGAGLGRRQFLGGLAATGAAVGAGGLLAACGSSGGTATSPTPSASGTAKRGGALSVGLTGGSGQDTLDPHKGLTYLDTARAQSLYQPLLQLNAQAQTEYVLAESISTHGSTSEWVIKLRPGITFHDGKPLTAQDVIFTFRRIISNKFAGANSLGPIDLNELKAADQHTVMVKMTKPYGSFVDQLAFWYYLYIVPDGYNPKQTPNGTGPFTYKSFTPGQRSVFVRNDNYWKPGLPHFDSVTIIDFTDSTSLQNALTTNVIDAAGGLEGAQMKELASNSAVKTIASKTGAITPFTMRVDQAPFNNVNVRQALRLIVNRPQLIDSALDGFGSVAADVFSPFDPSFKGFTREADIPQAKHLLKQAGQENLSVQLTTSPVATGTVSMATVLAEQAKAAGINISIQNVDPNKFFAPGKYLSWTFSQDFYNYSPYLAQVAQSMLPASPFNETHTDNAQYNAWYKEANETLSTTKRRAIEQEMQTFDFNEGGYIIPCFIDALDAYSTKITGYGPAKVGQPLSDFSFEEWSLA